MERRREAGAGDETAIEADGEKIEAAGISMLLACGCTVPLAPTTSSLRLLDADDDTRLLECQKNFTISDLFV